MLTDRQMRSYAIVIEKDLKCNFNMKSPFLQQKIKEAKEQGRPLIGRDLTDGDEDYQILKRINLSLNDGIGTMGETYGSLTQNQEAQLNRIINEYGASILDDDLKIKLEKYRQRQAYMGTNNINGTYEQSQSTDTEQTKPADRDDFHRVYDGFEYGTQKFIKPATSTILPNIVPNILNSVINSVIRY